MAARQEAPLFRWLFLSFPNLPETAPDAELLGGFRALSQYTALRNLSLYGVRPVPMKVQTNVSVLRVCVRVCMRVRCACECVCVCECVTALTHTQL